MTTDNPKRGHPAILPTENSKVADTEKISVEPPSPDQLVSKSPAK